MVSGELPGDAMMRRSPYEHHMLTVLAEVLNLYQNTKSLFYVSCMRIFHTDVSLQLVDANRPAFSEAQLGISDHR